MSDQTARPVHTRSPRSGGPSARLLLTGRGLSGLLAAQSAQDPADSDGQQAGNQGRDEVDPEGIERAGEERRTERASWIHGSPRNLDAQDAVQRDGKADRGIKYINYIVPGYSIFAIMAIALGTMTGNLDAEQQFGVLKRLGGTPLPRVYLLTAQVIAGSLLAAAVIIVLIVFGVIFYGAHVRGNPLAALVVLAVATLSFASLGIGREARSSRIRR